MASPVQEGLTGKRFISSEPCSKGHVGLRYKANGYCVICQRVNVKAWQQRNKKPRKLQSYEEKLRKRVAYNREWRRANPEKARAHSKSWVSKNHSSVMARVRKRQAILMQRLPKWADLEKIKAIYKLASTLNRSELGIKYHVDHIIPLNGEDVCGLHVENNLQVIPARLNLSKGNRRCESEEDREAWNLAHLSR